MITAEDSNDNRSPMMKARKLARGILHDDRLRTAARIRALREDLRCERDRADDLAKIVAEFQMAKSSAKPSPRIFPTDCITEPRP